MWISMHKFSTTKKYVKLMIFDIFLSELNISIDRYSKKRCRKE